MLDTGHWKIMDSLHVLTVITPWTLMEREINEVLEQILYNDVEKG